MAQKNFHTIPLWCHLVLLTIIAEPNEWSSNTNVIVCYNGMLIEIQVTSLRANKFPLLNSLLLVLANMWVSITLIKSWTNWPRLAYLLFFASKKIQLFSWGLPVTSSSSTSSFDGLLEMWNNTPTENYCCGNLRDTWKHLIAWQ